MTGTILEYSDNLTETFRPVVRIKYDILSRQLETFSLRFANFLNNELSRR